VTLPWPATYLKHFKGVRRWLEQRVEPPEVAEEIAQETFLKASRARFDGERAHVSTWLIAIARNALVDHVRRMSDLPALENPPDAIDPSPTADEELTYLPDLSRYPKPQRQVLELLLQGYRFPEIAKKLRTTPAAVKNRVLRAKG
jgi:RNA polymerase sigma factor (sigma-70 family)